MRGYNPGVPRALASLLAAASEGDRDHWLTLLECLPRRVGDVLMERYRMLSDGARGPLGFILGTLTVSLVAGVNVIGAAIILTIALPIMGCVMAAREGFG
jgi:hypothetical protein